MRDAQNGSRYFSNRPRRRPSSSFLGFDDDDDDEDDDEDEGRGTRDEGRGTIG